jgi:hypothetical protein
MIIDHAEEKEDRCLEIAAFLQTLLEKQFSFTNVTATASTIANPMATPIHTRLLDSG